MSPETETFENGILIVTGSNLHAEQTDRPMAYLLANALQDRLKAIGSSSKVTVISDLWYLNSEPLKELPTISIGAPNINAVSAFFSRRLDNILSIDNTLTIQMDVSCTDLRVALWGSCTKNTQEAIILFNEKGYLNQFIEATFRWYSHPHSGNIHNKH